MKTVINIKTDKKARKNTQKMSPKLEKLLDRVEKDIKNKRNISKGFSSVDEIVKYLDSL